MEFRNPGLGTIHHANAHGNRNFTVPGLAWNSIFDFQPCFSGAKLPGNTPKMVANHSLNKNIDFVVL